MYVCMYVSEFVNIEQYASMEKIHLCHSTYTSVHICYNVLVKVCCLLQLHNFRVMSIFLCVCKVDLF